MVAGLGEHLVLLSGQDGDAVGCGNGKACKETGGTQFFCQRSVHDAERPNTGCEWRRRRNDQGVGPACARSSLQPHRYLPGHFRGVCRRWRPRLLRRSGQRDQDLGFAQGRRCLEHAGAHRHDHGAAAEPGRVDAAVQLHGQHRAHLGHAPLRRGVALQTRHGGSHAQLRKEPPPLRLVPRCEQGGGGVSGQDGLRLERRGRQDPLQTPWSHGMRQRRRHPPLPAHHRLRELRQEDLPRRNRGRVDARSWRFSCLDLDLGDSLQARARSRRFARAFGGP
mmetsp:Transcript_30727/g.72682  ORF Transcript_30727/g.72682 Transcript_30727/m.72682 type:complete len:279 (+) Transcript_30727:327-1163(+)